MKCCICGKEFNERCYGGEYSEVCSDDCFTEKFWLIKVEAHNKKPFIIVNGVLYNDGGHKENPRNASFLGHSGRLFNIMMEDGTLIKTNNLWCAGDIPENFRDRLKDNAKFI